MADLMKVIHVAAKIDKMHATATKLYGADWRKKYNDWEPIIHACMRKNNCDALQAGLIMSKRLEDLPEDNSFSVMIIFAVIKEMIEPES